MCSLYTPHGVKIEDPSQLVNGAVYVAVGSEMGGHFQYRDYGLTKIQLDRGRKKYPFQWRKKSERSLYCLLFFYFLTFVLHSRSVLCRPGHRAPNTF